MLFFFIIRIFVLFLYQKFLDFFLVFLKTSCLSFSFSALGFQEN